MIGASNPVDFQLKAASVPPDDPIFDFSCIDWIDPPKFITTLPETTKESIIRDMAEKEYRASTTPTAWHRYITLGRYATDGFTFDSIMSELLIDPRKVHCLIWFQYSYHLDHKIAIPDKLHAWYSDRSKLFLVTNHLTSAFDLDTTKSTWNDYSRSQSLSNPWSEVQSAKQKRQKKKGSLPVGYYSTAASTLVDRSKPSTIIEEPSSKGSNSTFSRGTKRSSTNDTTSTASDGKQSVLEQSLNIPVCDGTHRVTLRWKTTLDLNKISSQTQAIKDEILKLLNDIFDDDDGLLYPWLQEETDAPKMISTMSSNTVRQYLCPSISIIPTQSTLVIPLRFGFSSSTPAKWRNLPSTRTKLEKHAVTVSFSNCTSTSGDLTTAGYILLKAPMTTHRLRYLQSLRQLLPPTTPPFDILLHKRSPLDQQIPHLVVQCGNKTVHSLSESLANILTGDGSALYIPRFALSHMTESESQDLFSTHDAHVKSLRWLTLNPLLSNLDKPRKEHNPDGTTTIRTTREWARSIKALDGITSAQCDVVNGGLDQLCYLLFLPQYSEAASNALEIYRRRLYPFTQREAKFRDSVGPPPDIQMSRSIIANLDFIKRLSTSSQKSDDTTNTPVSAPQDNTSTVTPDSDITDTSPLPASRPPTSAESLRKLYSQRTSVHNSFDSASSTTDDDDESTSATTVTEVSKLSAGRMSTSSAKIRELDAVIQRQQKTIAKKEAKSSERISSLERQLHRISDLDTKLDEVQNDFGCRLNLFEARMVESVTSTMHSNMQQLMALVTKIAATEKENISDILSLTEVPAPIAPSLVLRDQLLYNGSSSSSFNSGSSRSHPNSKSSSSSSSAMSVESTARIQSPEHKRPRSAKKTLKPSIRRYLDSALEAASATQPNDSTPPSTDGTSDSLDNILKTADALMKTDFSSTCQCIYHPCYCATDYCTQYTASTRAYRITALLETTTVLV